MCQLVHESMSPLYVFSHNDLAKIIQELCWSVAIAIAPYSGENHLLLFLDAAQQRYAVVIYS